MATQISTKIRLLSHSALAKRLLAFLQEKEIFHLSAQSQTRETAIHKGTHTWGEIESALRFLAPYEEKKGGITRIFVGSKVLSSEKEILSLQKKFPLKKVLMEIQKAEHSKNKQSSLLLKQEEQGIFWDEWKDVSLSAAFKSKEYSVMFCKFQRIAEESLHDGLSSLPRLSHLEILGTTKLSVLGMIIFHHEEKKLLHEFLSAHDGSEVQLETNGSSPQKVFARIQKEKLSAEKSLAQVEQSIIKLSEHTDDLKLLSDYYLWEKQKENMLQNTGEVGTSVLSLEGWIPQDAIDDFEKELNKKFPETHLEKIEPEKGEVAPVELKNKSVFKPFEIITRLFGLPSPTELDPTPYLTPFFIIFFAFCLTDAGYGILITIMTFLVLKFFKMESGTREMFRLLFVGGIATIVMGAIFGGWFGIPVENLPPFLQKLQIFDPIDDLVSKVGPLALGLGVLQLWFGVLLSGITKVKNGHISEAWQTSFPLALLVLASIAWPVVGSLGFVEAAKILKYVFLGLLLFMVWGFGYGTKNILVRPIMGVFGILNEVMGWLSNVLSYSRLFALGLATGIIAQVFNEVAFTIGGILPVGLNVIMIVFIILFGHTLNIGLNTLGSFIHSGRLQFVEFFGKFMEGGGSQFRPFKKERQYLFLESS